MKVKSESEVAQSCPSLSDPINCSLPGSSVHGIFQARVLEWDAIALWLEKSKETHGFTSATSPDLMSNPDLYAIIRIAEMFHFENRLPRT